MRRRISNQTLVEWFTEHYVKTGLAHPVKEVSMTDEATPEFEAESGRTFEFTIEGYLDSPDGSYPVSYTERSTKPIDPDEIVETIQFLSGQLGLKPHSKALGQALAAVPGQPARPACPKHGSEKVADSKYEDGGYYCRAKDPAGPRGYCTWQADAQGNQKKAAA